PPRPVPQRPLLAYCFLPSRPPRAAITPASPPPHLFHHHHHSFLSSSSFSSPPSPSPSPPPFLLPAPPIVPSAAVLSFSLFERRLFGVPLSAAPSNLEKASSTASFPTASSRSCQSASTLSVHSVHPIVAGRLLLPPVALKLIGLRLPRPPLVTTGRLPPHPRSFPASISTARHPLFPGQLPPPRGSPSRRTHHRQQVHLAVSPLLDQFPSDFPPTISGCCASFLVAFSLRSIHYGPRDFIILGHPCKWTTQRHSSGTII
ncbi:hypothetical protein T310_8593, partial [Rasamsonia emersonii CBS 393.64]